MGHNKIKWNISLEKGIEIAHKTIIEILRENKNPTSLNELVFLVNNRTKVYKINNDKKNNCFIKYLRVNHGGIVKFLDTYCIYGLIYNNNNISVKLLEDLLEDEYKPIKNITKDSDWIFI
tara:strand:- start:368 stop:727 length:360 start_codon:yes stop_codon:yes gene_type:complete